MENFISYIFCYGKNVQDIVPFGVTILMFPLFSLALTQTNQEKAARKIMKDSKFKKHKV